MFAPLAHSPLSDITPPGAVTQTGAGVLIAPLPEMAGGTLSMSFILTRRPPVALKEARRVSTDNVTAAGWTTVLQVAEYRIPATLAAPVRTVSTRYVLSRLVAASPAGVAASLAVRVINLRDESTRIVFPELDVPATGFLDIPLQSSVIDAQEVLQVKSLSGGEIHVTASYVNVTREQFTVVP